MVLPAEDDADVRAPEIEVADTDGHQVVVGIRERSDVADVAAQPEDVIEEPHHAAANVETELVAVDFERLVRVGVLLYESDAGKAEGPDAAAPLTTDGDPEDDIAHRREDVARTGEIHVIIVGFEELRRELEIAFDADDARSHPSDRRTVRDVLASIGRPAERRADVGGE